MAEDWMGGAASSHSLPALGVDIPPLPSYLPPLPTPSTAVLLA